MLFRRRRRAGSPAARARPARQARPGAGEGLRPGRCRSSVGRDRGRRPRARHRRSCRPVSLADRGRAAYLLRLAVMAAFTIRPAGLADAEAMCALHKAAVRALCMGAYSAEEIDAWLSDRAPAAFRHAMTQGGETMLVAERDDVVEGFASIKGTVLFGLYVDPARGRGAGRLLLAAVEDEVRRRGATV